VRAEERFQSIKRFQSSSSSSSCIDDEESQKVFLLSTRSGGVGINLQAANFVLFVDSDWFFYYLKREMR